MPAITVSSGDELHDAALSVITLIIVGLTLAAVLASPPATRIPIPGYDRQQAR